jgi:hypothetical protein
MPPLLIMIVLHYHITGYPESPPQEDSPATKKFIEQLCDAGILEHVDVRHYRITEKGRAWVRMICATPYPEQQWVDPRSNTCPA